MISQNFYLFWRLSIGASLPFPPLCWRKLINRLKGSGEMEGIGISHQAGNLRDGKVCGAKELASLIHAVLDQKILRAFGGDPLKQLAEIASVQIQIRGQILHSNLIHIMLLNKIYRGLDIKVLDVILYRSFPSYGASDQGAEK